MKLRKRVLIFTPALMDDGYHEAGCRCGHTLFHGEMFIGYPCDNGEYQFVCLTCHFHNVMASIT